MENYRGRCQREGGVHTATMETPIGLAMMDLATTQVRNSQPALHNEKPPRICKFLLYVTPNLGYLSVQSTTLCTSTYLQTSDSDDNSDVQIRSGQGFAFKIQALAGSVQCLGSYVYLLL